MYGDNDVLQCQCAVGRCSAVLEEEGLPRAPSYAPTWMSSSKQHRRGW